MRCSPSGRDSYLARAGVSSRSSLPARWRLARYGFWFALASSLGSAAFAQSTERLPPALPVSAVERNYSAAEVRALVREELEAYEKSRAEAAESKGYAVGSDLGLKATWNHGLYFESAHKDFKVHVGGRYQQDAVWLDGDDALQFGAGGIGPLEDSLNLRRARFRMDGTIYEVVDFAAEFDFINQFDDDPLDPPTNASVINSPAPTDLWVTLTHLPAIGNARMGIMKEPIGLEHLNSSRYLDFMERSFLQDAFFGPFNNGFSGGLMVFNTEFDERATWWLGVFKNNSNIFGNGYGDGEYAVTGRVTALPWYEAEGRYLLHLGLAGSLRDLDDDAVRLRSRASLRNGNPGPYNAVIANTGTIFGDNQNLLAGEVAAVLGSLHLQGEYVGSWVTDAITNNVPRGEYYAQGGYAQATWFLTGEHRPYNRKTGAFDRVIPYTNFFWVDTGHGCCWGLGAWQLAARYGWLDLRDAGIDGGVIQDVTLGLNWFLNPNMKIQFNYVTAHRDAPGATSDGNFQGFGTRFAFDF